jgi:hypothetical protein
LLALLLLLLLIGVIVFVIWIFTKIHEERRLGFNFLIIFGMAVGAGVILITGFIIIFNMFVTIGRS